MFRKMRRFKQQVDDAQAAQIMREGSYGVLAVSGDDGYPYAVPMSYAFIDAKDDKPACIVLHSAKVGHKIDAIAKNPKVSFAGVSKNQVVSAEFTTYYQSAIAFGSARIVEAENEKRKLLEALGNKYSFREPPESLAAEITNAGPHCHIIEISIDYLTGKQAKELM